MTPCGSMTPPATSSLPPCTYPAQMGSFSGGAGSGRDPESYFGSQATRQKPKQKANPSPSSALGQYPLQDLAN